MSTVGSNTLEGIACALWCGGAAGQVPVVEGKELPLPDALRALRLAVVAELRQTAPASGSRPSPWGTCWLSTKASTAMAETDDSTAENPGPNIPPLHVTLEHAGSGARRQGVVVNCERSGRHVVARIRMGLAGLFYYRLTNGYGREKSCQYWRVVEADELRTYAREHFGLDVQEGPAPRLKMGPQVGAARRSAKLKRLHPKQTEMWE